MASNGRDAYMTFDSLTAEGYSGVFDLLAREILRQREREAVWKDLQDVLDRASASKIGNFLKICNLLASSFSAVSKRNLARKFAFDSIFQALQDLHTSAPLQSQIFSKKSV